MYSLQKLKSLYFNIKHDKFPIRIRNNVSTLEINKPVTNGGKFLVTGWYKYLDHVTDKNTDCFVPEQSSRMLFKKGEVAPLLGSCEHAIRWKLTSVY